MATERIGRAILELLTDSAKFFQDVDKAKKEAGSLRKSFEDASKGLSSFGSGATSFGTSLTAGVTLPIVAAVGGLVTLAVQAGKTGDDIAKAAREAGLSAQSYQELTFAVGQVAKISEEQLTKAFGKITIAIGDAAAGNKTAIDSLKELGFTQQEIAAGTITTEQAFERLTQKMQSAGSEAEAMALAGELVGDRVGPKLAGALRTSGDQVDVLRKQFRDLGLGMSEESLAASEVFNDQMDVLQRQMGALGRTIGGTLLPVLTKELIPALIEDGVPALKAVVEWVAKAVQWFLELPRPVQMAAGGFLAIVAAAGPVLVVLGQMSLGLGGIVKAMGVASSTSTLMATRLPVLATAIKGLNAALMGPLGLIALLGGAAVAFTLWETSKINAKTEQIVKEIELVNKARKLLQDSAVTDPKEAGKILEAFDAGKTGAKLADLEGATTRVAAAWLKGAEAAKALGKESAITNEQIGATSFKLKGVAAAATEALTPNDRLRLSQESLAKANRDYAEALADKRAAVTFDIRHMKELGLSVEDIGVKHRIGAEHVQRLKEELEKGAKTSEKAEKAAEALAKKLEKQRDALQSLGVVTKDTVNEALAEFATLVDHAAKAGVPMDRIIAALHPKLKELKEQADASGVEVAELTDALDDAARAALRFSRESLDEIIRKVPRAVDGIEELPGTVLDLNRVMSVSGILAGNVAESYRFFGLSTRAQLEATARAAVVHYETIRDSGTATPAAVQEAFEKAQEAIVAAGGKVKTSWVRELGEIASMLRSVGGAFDNTFGDILQGAADVVQGIGNIASATSKLGAIAATVDLGAKIGKQLQPLLGLNRGLLGRFLGTNNQGRNDVEDFVEKTFGSFKHLQERLARIPGGEQLWRNLTQLRNNWDTNEAAAAIKAIETAIGAAEIRTAKFNSSLSTTLQKVRDLGGQLPESVRPYLESLREAGQLTEDNVALLAELTGGGAVDWRKIEEAANRYGITQANLGSSFHKLKLHDAWQQLIDDIDLFERGGVDVNAQLAEMSDEISDLVQDSIKFGTEIPENMRPWIAKLIESGRLLDENGDAITDIGKLTFGQSLQTSLQNLIDKVQELIDALLDVPGAAAAADSAANAGARPRPASPAPRVDDSGMTPEEHQDYLDNRPPPDLSPSYPYRGGYVTPHGVQYLTSGGLLRSLFKPKGSDTVPAMLTPGEGVLNLNAMRLIGTAGLRDLNAARVPAVQSAGSAKVGQEINMGGLTINVPGMVVDSADRVNQLATTIVQKIRGNLNGIGTDLFLHGQTVGGF